MIAIIDFAFVTYSELKDLDPDDRLLFNALKAKGYRCQPVVWDNPDIDWRSVKIALLRSTWDYHLKYAQFLKWLDVISYQTMLVNCAQIIRWNLDKNYLEHFAQKDLAVVPTIYLKSGQKTDISLLMQDKKWNDIVAKPAIGNGTYGIKRINSDINNGQSHVENLLSKTDVLIQPYFSSVENYGEKDLIFIDGAYSHCIEKRPFQISAVAGQAGEVLAEAKEEEILLAKKIFAAVEPEPFYARVDLVRDANDKPCLLELELSEANLFFSFYPAAIDKFADGIIRLFESTKFENQIKAM